MSNQMSKHLVSMEWLAEHLHDPGVRIADCRFQLGEPETGKNKYGVDHIPGAVHFDLEKDLSGEKQQHGGRHPLPDIGEFSRKLGAAGIDNSVKVIAYDDQGGMMACRFWWMLRYLGHQEVYVLDGKYSLWKTQGYPVTSELPQPEPRVYQPQVQDGIVADINEVKLKKDLPQTVLIDSRDNRRYSGLEEPIDRVAGHIPGAVNYFWAEGLHADGVWKTSEEQLRRFQGIDPQKEMLVYCGSGVTACANILALQEAGFSRVKLYVGSWSDWCSYEENPVAGEEE